MKKIISSLVFFLTTTIAIAQITFTQDDFPKAGEIWVRHPIFFFSTSDSFLAPTSSPQFWNIGFSSWITDSITSTVFSAPRNIPHNTYEAISDTFNAFNDYESFLYKYDSTGFYCDTEFFYSLALDSIEGYTTWYKSFPILPAPFTYGSKRTDTSYADHGKGFEAYGNVSCPGDLYSSTIITTFESDAYGNLTTPYYDSVPVIRIKVTRHISTDYSYCVSHCICNYLSTFYDSTLTYLFVKNGTNCIAYEMRCDPVTKQLSEEYYYGNQYSTAVSDIKSAGNIKLYPNPASGNLIVSGYAPTFTKLEVLDITGRKIIEQTINGQDKQSVVDVNNLPQGLYLLYIKGTNEKVTVKKFIKQ